MVSVTNALRCTGKKLFASHVVRKEFLPVYSYFHLQSSKEVEDDMFDRIKYGIAKNPSGVHSMDWCSRYQISNSIVDMITHADSHKCRLLLRVCPYDTYSYFLWKGIRQMYPNTFIFPKYSVSRKEDRVKLVNDCDNNPWMLKNVLLQFSNPNIGCVDDVNFATNILMTSDCISTSTDPTYATWLYNNKRSSQTVLFVPLSV